MIKVVSIVNAIIEGKIIGLRYNLISENSKYPFLKKLLKKNHFLKFTILNIRFILTL